jgi:hypothetical protein
MGWDANTFLPPLQSAEVLGASSQAPTPFYTFDQRGRIWSAHLSFALGTNSSFTSSTFRAYAQIITGSGIAFGGPVELQVSNHNQAVNGDADLKIDGLLVGANDTLLLDVNNGTPVPGGGGVMAASCVVLYSIP